MSQNTIDRGMLLHCSDLKYHPFSHVIQKTIESLEVDYGLQIQPTQWSQVGSLDRGNFRILNDMNPAFLSILIDGQFKLADPRSTSTWETTIPKLREYPNLRQTPIIGISSTNISYYRGNDKHSQVVHLIEAPRSVIEAAERLDILSAITQLIP